MVNFVPDSSAGRFCPASMAKDVFGRPTSDKIMFPRAASGTVSIASSCEQVRVYPRRMDRKSVRSTNIPQSPIVLTRKMLEPFFGRPLSEAAEHVGLSITALKSVCRKLGIRRWPYQQSKSRRKAGAADAMSSSSSMSAANMVEVDALGAANKGEMHPRLDRGQCESPMDLCSGVGLIGESALGDEEPLDEGEASAMVTPEYAEGDMHPRLDRGQFVSSMDLCSGVGLIDESALYDEEPLDKGEASAMVTPEYAVRTLAPEHDLRQHVPMYPTPTYMTGCHADSFRCCMPAKAKGLPALPFSHRLQTAPDGPELQLHLLHEDGTKALPHCIDTISEIFGRYCDNANLLEMSFGEALQKSNIDCTMYPHAVVEAMKADFRRKKNRLFGLFSRRKKEARMADLEERQRVLLLQNQFLALQLEVMEKENVHLHSQEIGSSDPRLAVLSEIAGSPSHASMDPDLGSRTIEPPQGSREQGGGHRRAVACAVSRAPQLSVSASLWLCRMGWEPLAKSDGLEAEVRLLGLAQKLEPDAWTEFTQEMLARGCQDGLDGDDSSACDMSWLSPC